MQRAAAWSPIGPCTRWGFPCLRACAWSGGLLLHLFTLTPLFLNAFSFRARRPGNSQARRPRYAFRKSGAVYFLWHCPSANLAILPPACIPICRSERVTRHRALWCSDFPPLSTLSRNRSDSPPFQNQGEYSFFG